MHVKATDVKVGDELRYTGADFCLKQGEVYGVFQHPETLQLGVRCKLGTHYLQQGVHGEFEGFTKVEEPRQEREQF